MQSSLTTDTVVTDALEAFRSGRFVLIVDDASSELSGSLMCAASAADAEHVNFLATHARGLICLAMTAKRVQELELFCMDSDDGNSIPFTVSIEAATGVSTGISAGDRARTVEVAIDPESGPDDVVSPGHLFPVRVAPGGVLNVPSIAAAGVDMAALLTLEADSGVYSQILSESGELANEIELEALSEKHELSMVRLSQIIRYRMARECVVTPSESFAIDTRHGPATVTIWTNELDGNHHVLMSRGVADPGPDAPAPVVRMHSQCLTGDVFRSQRCDCGQQLEAALEQFSVESNAAILYLRQEGRGIGLVNKLKAYALQDRGRDTVEANVELGFSPDDRDYGIGAQILMAAGYNRVRLMTNNPMKLSDLQVFGIDVTERVAMSPQTTSANRRYLEVKRDKLGHLLESLS